MSQRPELIDCELVPLHALKSVRVRARRDEPARADVVRLKLDRIGAGLGGKPQQEPGLLKVAFMIDADFGDQQGRTIQIECADSHLASAPSAWNTWRLFIPYTNRS